MNRSLLRGIALCALLLQLPALLIQCGGSAETVPGTETGNPPVLDERKLHLEVVGEGVRISGDAGAVVPGGARVIITHSRSNERVEVRTNSDGSFSVVVPGEPGDVYEISVESGGQSTSLELTFVRTDVDGTKDPADNTTNPPTLMVGSECQALEANLNDTLQTAFDNADRTCAMDSDCVEVGWSDGAECYNSCAVTVLSRAGRAEIQQDVITESSSLCSALEGCLREPPPCTPELSSVFCNAGRCESTISPDLSCEALAAGATRRRAELLSNASRACSADADCVVDLAIVSCVNSCAEDFIPLNRAAQGTLSRDLTGEVSQTFCSTFYDRGCPFDGSCAVDRDERFNLICNDSGQCELNRTFPDDIPPVDDDSPASP